ncbi:MAG: helix-turn-helix domain-containing protein [Pseudonocardiaceae bacterium]|nr:MAG: helix-turn-helix domain-containing protein [Pseudonocardiaceae bacterium]
MSARSAIYADDARPYGSPAIYASHADQCQRCNQCDLCEHGAVPPETADSERLVSTTTAAKALGVHQTTLSRWAAAGHVKPAQKTIGGHMRWNLDDLRAQVERITSTD